MQLQAFDSTPPLEASDMVQSGDWVLVDLRPASRHREAHPQGAANVPLYKEVAESLHIDSDIHLSTKAVRTCSQCPNAACQGIWSLWCGV